jgi:hypothetical protein
MSQLRRKEIAIVKVLVRLNDEDVLGYDNISDLYSNGGSNLVMTALKMLGLKLPNDLLTIQYQIYAYDNYNKIKEGDFSTPIERMVPTTFYFDTTESQIVYRRYEIVSYSFPSMVKKTGRILEDEFWEYDPEEVSIDYGDSDTHVISFEDYDIDESDKFTLG